METTLAKIVICAVIFNCLSSYLEAFPSNFEDNLESVPNSVNPPEHHHGRSSSEGATTWAEASPSSPSGVDPNTNTINQISQIFGIRFRNNSESRSKRKDKHLKKNGTPQFMLDLYKRVANSTNGETFGDTPYDATTIRSLMIEKGNRSNRNVLHFKVDSIPSSERLLRAELHLFRLLSKLKGTSRRPRYYLVGIYQRTDNGKARLIDQKEVTSRGTGREVFNVDSTVHEWLTDAITNHGLYINVTLLSGEPAPEGSLRFSLKNIDRKPTLVLFTREETDKEDGGSGHFLKSDGSLPKFIEESNLPVIPPDTASSPTTDVVTPARNKRGIRGIKSLYDSSDGLCRVESMFVDFGVLGWSQRILAPEGFNANQCTGSCPFPNNNDTPYSTHALVQSFMSIQSPGHTVQSACCVPHELSPVAILYVDESNNIILRHVKNAVAVKCGCH